MTKGLVPFAQHELIRPGVNDPRIKPVGNVFHVAVSMADDLHDYFNGPSGGIESHGYILMDGTLKQYRNCLYQADAQSLGNSWDEGGETVGLLSWETQGMGDGTWTDAQLETIKRLISWSNGEFDIPIQLIPAWDGHGNGYHCQFTQWNPDNHSCPGPQRVKQFNDIIVPWMNQGGQEDDVSAQDVWNYDIPIYDNSQKDGKARAHVVLAQAHARAGDARRTSGKSLQLLGKLADLVSNNKLTDQDKANLAQQIADEIKAEVATLDAEDIANHLDVTFKE